MRILIILMVAAVLIGCAMTKDAVIAEKKECNRTVYNPNTGEFDPFPCLGGVIKWYDTDFTLVAEAIHPETKFLIGFFDFTNDCVIDVAGVYGICQESEPNCYYAMQSIDPDTALAIIAEIEAERDMVLLKKADCLEETFKKMSEPDPNRFEQENSI